MDKKTYIKKWLLWTAVVVAAIIAIAAICFGKVVEANLFEEVAKWVFMYLVITAVLELFVGFLFAPLFYHRKYDVKK